MDRVRERENERRKEGSEEGSGEGLRCVGREGIECVEMRRDDKERKQGSRGQGKGRGERLIVINVYPLL